jgi:hypothetical protein
MTCEDLARVTGAGGILADFLVLRRNRPAASYEISMLISDLYKHHGIRRPLVYVAPGLLQSADEGDGGRA